MCFSFCQTSFVILPVARHIFTYARYGLRQYAPTPYVTLVSRYTAVSKATAVKGASK
jgi:hypothetical protein